MITLLAIDPGTTSSGWVLFKEGKPFKWGSRLNNAHFGVLEPVDIVDHVVFEWVSSYGKPVGESIFQTCLWVGRMIENLHVPFDLITRREVKKILGLKGKKIGDKEIRAEMIKRWGQLPGMASHGWQALALGTAWLIKNGHLGLDKGAETR